MNLLAHVNRDDFGRSFGPSARTQESGSGDQLGTFPIDPAGLLGVLARLHTLGLADLASGGRANGSNATASAAANPPRPDTELTRRRYVSGIADQFGRSNMNAEGGTRSTIDRGASQGAFGAGGFPTGLQNREGGDEAGVVLPAVLRNSNIGTGAQPSPGWQPAQFSARIPVPGLGQPTMFPPGSFDEWQKHAERGLMGLWRFFRDGSGNSGGGGSSPDRNSPECKEQWAKAIEDCREELFKVSPSRARTGGYDDIANCAKGLVSEACGGGKYERPKEPKVKRYGPFE